jgi:regulator of sigma E protease
MILTIITFIIVLGLLVFVHEFGHFITARRFGVKAEEFGFGFPPRIMGVFKASDGTWKYVKGNKKVEAPDTIFSLNWVPLGGFVKIKGEDGESQDPDSFVTSKVWQRFIILLSGVSMNVILAAVLISIGLVIGLPQVIDDVGPQAKIANEQIQILEVLPDSPAQVADLKLGDVIFSVDGNQFTKYDELTAYLDSHVGQELTYIIKREDEELTKQIIPEVREETGQGGIGVAIAETGIVSYPWYIAIWEGIKTTVLLTWAIIMAFTNLFISLIKGQGVTADIAGPVGIAVITGQVTRLGFIYVLQFTAMLSINLAIINAFPFPALDGGRILFLLIEKVIGRPVKREVEAVIHNIGFALLILLILVVTFRDFSRFGDSFRLLWERIIG